MTSVTKVTLDLDEEGGNDVPSIVDGSIAEGIENEKCVVAQYRTTAKQKQLFTDHLKTCSREDIPIEWVIDIADETNGWFYATAYSFDDINQTLYVMVPDKINPTFKGNVQLDHRTVHLIECVDVKSMALFNKIVRDSVIKIKWDVEWFEEAEDGGEGNWIPSPARYYIRIANQLLVEEKAQGTDETRGFVIIFADLNVKLLRCHKSRGIDDYEWLIREGIVQSKPDIITSDSNAISPMQSPTARALSPMNNNHNSSQQEMISSSSSSSTIRKLAESARILKECILDMIDDRERKRKDDDELTNLFQGFTLDGDLDKGLELVKQFEKLKNRNNGRSKTPEFEEEEKLQNTITDAKYLSGKMEKSLVKLVQSGQEISLNTNDEIGDLKKTLKKLKRDLDEKEKELWTLRSAK
jgi:hypothetical protein